MWYPQGTVLGPFLFSKYINDIIEICQGSSELYFYANDAKLFNYINSITEVNNNQFDLEHMDRWIEDCPLKLNIKKCQVVSCGRQQISHTRIISLAMKKLREQNKLQTYG